MQRTRSAILAATLAATLGASTARAAEPPSAPAYGPNLEAFDYGYPVHAFAFTSQGQALSMAYIDVPPAGASNGRTAVLLHGKNFCAATWDTTVRALSGAGFRVIAPDQVGFCKSTKPDGYQFTFVQLAANTRALLQSLGIERSVVIGHSTGGMLAIRYGLTYPAATEHLVLVDPVGLEDWKAKGVPVITVDEWTEREMKTTVDGIRAYQTATYYAGTWKPEYQRWVDMYAGMFAGAGKPLVARVTARIDDMLLNQPVVYELGRLSMPTLLIVGLEDRTAIGKDMAPPELRATLGNYPELGKQAAAAIPGARLVEFPGLGHSPWVQDPGLVNGTIVEALRRP